jgi:hypothetical protein
MADNFHASLEGEAPVRLMERENFQPGIDSQSIPGPSERELLQQERQRQREARERQQQQNRGIRDEDVNDFFADVRHNSFLPPQQNFDDFDEDPPIRGGKKQSKKRKTHKRKINKRKINKRKTVKRRNKKSKQKR